MLIGVVGLGYLGLTHSIAMAMLGNRVIGYESDPAKLRAISNAEIPFHEPGLEYQLAELSGSGLFSVADHFGEGPVCDVYFICVGTPQTSSGNSADTSFVFSAGESLSKVIAPKTVVVGKSTVPVGTAAALRDRMSEVAGFPVHLALNP